MGSNASRSRRTGVLLAVSLVAVGALRAGSVEVDFDPKAPFEKYKTWGWVPDREKEQHGILIDATARQRVETALTDYLKGVGLVPAGPGTTPDLLVRYQGDIGTGKTITTSAGAIANWSDPGYATTQFQEQTASLIVDLIDAGTNTLCWRLYVDQKVGGPNDQRGKFRKAVGKGFAKYPPSPSERSKKLRELEKR